MPKNTYSGLQSYNEEKRLNPYTSSSSSSIPYGGSRIMKGSVIERVAAIRDALSYHLGMREFTGKKISFDEKMGINPNLIIDRAVKIAESEGVTVGSSLSLIEKVSKLEDILSGKSGSVVISNSDSDRKVMETMIITCGYSLVGSDGKASTNDEIKKKFELSCKKAGISNSLEEARSFLGL